MSRRRLRCKPTPDFSPAAWCMPSECSCLGQGWLSPAWSEKVDFHAATRWSGQLYAASYSNAIATCTVCWHTQPHTAARVQASCVQTPIPPGYTRPAAPIRGSCTKQCYEGSPSDASIVQCGDNVDDSAYGLVVVNVTVRVVQSTLLTHRTCERLSTAIWGSPQLVTLVYRCHKLAPNAPQAPASSLSSHCALIDSDASADVAKTAAIYHAPTGP